MDAQDSERTKTLPCKRSKLSEPQPSSSLVTTSITILNHDGLTEILVRLPIHVVHRFKCVSKNWLALISDPCFARCYIERRAKLPKPDEFIYGNVLLSEDDDKGLLGHVKLVSKSCQTSSLMYKEFDFPLNRLPLRQDFAEQNGLRFQYCLSRFAILGVSHGLLLCKAEFKHGFTPRHCASFLYVCNPLTKCWSRLPSLCRRYTLALRATGFMCYSKDDDHPFKMEFIVLEVERKNPDPNKGLFYVHVFSSTTGSWTILQVACPPTLKWSGPYTDNVVVHNGGFHWIADTCVVAYNPVNQPSKCCLIGLPPVSRFHGDLHQSEGQLRIVGYADDKSTHVWELADYDEGTWCLTYKVTIPSAWFRSFSQTNKELVCFKAYDGCISRKSMKVTLLNMRTSLSEDMPGDDGSYGYGVLPFVMTSWPIHVPQFSHEHQDE